MEGLFLSGLLLLTGLLFLLNARFVSRNILFSVFVPEQETNNSIIQTIKTRFIKQVIGLAVVIALLNGITFYVFQSSTGVLLFVIWIHLLIIGGVYLYKQAHDHLKAVKTQEDWMKDIKVVKATDTSLMVESSALPNFLLFMQLLGFIVAFIFVALNYDKIPDTIATHWNFNGEADDFSQKNFFSVYGVGIIGLLMLFTLWAAEKGTQFFNTTVNPVAKSASVKYIKQTKLINSMMMNLLSFTMTALFILILIRPVLFDSDYLPNGVFNTLIVIMILIVGVCIYLQVSEDRKFRHIVASSSDNKAPYYDEENYILGLFYFNKDDQNVWVPKLSDIGMTLNMARPMSWFIAFMLIGLPFVIIAFIAIFS
ncbi:DUF1648 domain-containing protein [Macrococcus capreoli]|uniref:DUF1648 domain-containing protein n=1 Tax=Macrococcus capreoli TaxID=2982690 RepID=UPI0021D57AC3|nr:DUF1648 domain-containing protein [Macrococcus sp. TMW 2.2395]MCU7558482.1 DUF1648 domain-containing protein [Macrococcus sp. TMW 2.2395]